MATHPMGPEELDRWYRTPSDLNVWEDIAAWFHEDTGHLRPGKDKPIGFHYTEEGELDCCHEAWLAWTSQKRSEAIAGLLKERTRHIDTLKMIASQDKPYLDYTTTAALAEAALRGSSND